MTPFIINVRYFKLGRPYETTSFFRFSSIFRGLLDFADRCNHWEPAPSGDDAGLAKERSFLHGLRCVQYIRYCDVFSKEVGRRHLPTNLHCMPLDTTTTSPTQPFFFYVMTTGYYNIIFEVIIVVLQRHRYRRRSQRTSKTVAAAEVEIMACGGYDRSIILAKRGGRGGCRPTLNRSLS
jgi:hypothetical protein